MNTKHTKKLAYSITLGLLMSTSLYTGVVAAPAANAVPTGNTNVAGANTVTTGGTTAAPVMTVTQVNPADSEGNVTSHTAQINWATFNIGSAATVNFKQTSSGDTMINNVAATGGLSQIYGKMNATGNVVLINPNGAIFANGSQVNVGGLAVYAANSTDLSNPLDKTNQANITIEGGASINAGISTALSNLNVVGIDAADYAIGINQYTNRIRLVANGNITIGAATLKANDTTYVDNSQSNLGEEGYSTSESSNEMYGQIAIRADANADDYGQVTVNGTPVLTTQESRIYTNPELAGVNTTADGVQYNRKNYNKVDATDAQFSMVKADHVTVTATADDTGATVLADTTNKYVTTANSGTETANVRMLVNNIAQLQDIDPNTTNNNGKNADYGNLGGKYAMGKTIDATSDKASYLKDGVLYKADANGNKAAVSVTDSGVFTTATTKTLLDGTEITYTAASSKVSAKSGTDTYALTTNGSLSKTTGTATYTTNKDNSTSSYVNGTDKYTKTSTNSTYYNGTTTYTKTGTTTSYAATGVGTYSKATADSYAKLTVDASNYFTTDGTNVYKNGSTTAYAGTDAATVLADLIAATTTLNTVSTNIDTTNANIAQFITDADDTKTSLNIALTEFTGTNTATELATLGSATGTINSANWDTKKGFQPIGSTTAPFKGSMDGYGGDAGHPVNNLTIMRGGTNGTDGENNVGLFGVISGGSVSSFTLGGPKIQGQNNVGGIAGQLINKGTISWSSVTGSGQKGVADYTNAADTGYVATTRTGSGARENIGAVAGYVESSTITHVSNSATVIGQTNDGTINVSNVGGIAGKVINDPSTSSAAISKVTNGGNVFGEKATGGLVGYGENMSIGATAGKTDLTAASYNNGQITGLEDTGGIMGHAKGVTLKYVFNTNEDTPLSKNSMYYIDASGNIIKQGGTAGKALAGKALNSTDALSKYGQVTGVTNTGGLVGYMENYSDTKKSSIDIAYNAGNVTATGANTGGLVGQMTGGIINNAYNGDNNTVIKSDKSTTGEKPVPAAVINHKKADGTTPGWDVTVGSETKSFAYDEFSAKYYGFYTVDNNGNQTAYYFIPTNGTTTKGAGGIYVNAAGDIIDVNNSASTQYVKESDRFYFNRLAYKDANITGTTNVGGVIGNMSGGDVSTVYDVGTVKSTDTATTGGLIGIGTGTKTGTGTEADPYIYTTNLTDSFYITGSDKSLMNKVYSNQSKAIGSDTDVGKTGVKSAGRTLAEMESRDTIKATYTTDDWLGSITKVDTNTGRTVYSDNGTADAIQYDGKEKIFSGASDTVLYFRPTENGIQQDYYVAHEGDTVHYTLTTDASGNLTLTSNETTPTTITYTAEKVSSNQGTNWIVYEQQTLPLLKYYMTDIGLTRVFVYDGSTHNLKTDDVDNLYGRADFAYGSGQVVYKADEAESTLYPGSSEYYYDNSSIWSPQHGYIMDAMASVTITPKALDVVITGERTYGDVNNTQGYYLCVPYKDGETQKYAFYTVTGTGDTTAYSELSTTAQLNAFFGTYDQSEAGLKAKALADGHYVVTLNGIIDTEATAIDKAVKSAVTAVGNNTSGDSLNGIFSYNVTGGDQRLSATTADKKYTIDSTNVKGLVAQNNDYTITYSGALLVDKANLYYTYDGSRTYGEENSKGTHTYTLVGNETDSTGTTINGYLKSFDAGKLKIDTGNVLTDGVGATSYTMTGTTNGAYNNTDTTTKAITASTSNTYYQVIVNSTGTVIGYKLVTLDNGSNLALTGKTPDDTTYLNNNYNLIWAAGGAIDNVRKTTSSGVTTTSITANDSTQKIDPVDLTVTVEGQRTYGNTMTKDTDVLSTATPALMGNGTYYVYVNGLTAGDTTDVINNSALKTLLNGIETSYVNGTETKITNHTGVGTYDLKAGTVLPGSNILVSAQDTTTKQYTYLNDKNYNYKIVEGDHQEKITPRTVYIETDGSRTYGDANSTTTDYTVTAETKTSYNLTDWDKALLNDTVKTNMLTYMTNNVSVTDNATVYGSKGAAGNKYINTSDGVTKALVYSTAGNTYLSGVLNGNYQIKYDDKYTVNKAPLTITVTGRRDYGGNMTTSGTYTTTGGATSAVPDIDGLTKGLYNIDVSGVKTATTTDTAASVLNSSGLKTKLGKVDNGAGGNTATDVVGSHTNVGSYTKDSDADFTLDNTNAIGDSNSILSNNTSGSQNYYVVANGTNTLKIVPKEITITTTGEKAYGNDNPMQYTISDGNGIADWDKASKFTNHLTTWNGQVYNPAVINTAAGKYGTNSKADGSGTAYLRYGDASGSYEQTVKDDIGTNYNVTFKDLFTINQKAITLYIEGSRTYGDKTTFAKENEGTWDAQATGILDVDQKLWTDNRTTWYGTFKDNTDEQTTHVGTYGTDGADGNQYKSTGAIVSDATTIAAMKNTLSNYNVTITDKLTVNPASITATVTGERTYGDSMTKDAYTTTDGTTLTTGTWNLKLDGIKSWDATNNAANAIDLTGMQSFVNGIEQTYSTAADANKLTNHTNANANAYGLTGTGTLSGTTVNVTDSILKTQAQGGKDYIITNGEHSIKIDTRDVTITTKGEKVYGNADPATTSYTIDDTSAGSGLTSWDKDAYFTPNAATWKNSITNSTDEATHHGTYGTLGTPAAKVLDYAGTTTETTIANTLNTAGATNYNVSFADKFTVNKRLLTIITSGSKTYGDANPAADALSITAVAATADTGLVNQNGNLATFNTYATGTGTGNWRSLVTDNATTTTHAGTHGTNGTLDKSGILTYTDGNKNTISGNLNNDYDIKYQDLLTVNKAALAVNVAGERYYGDNMNAAYVTDGSGAPANKNYNVTSSGLKGSDTLTGVLSTTGLDAKLGAVDTSIGDNNSVIGRLTNASTTAYNVDGSNGSFGTITLDDTILGANSNYTVTPGTRTIKIDKAPVTYTISGSQNYGVNASTTKTTGASYTISALAGLKNSETFDQNKLTVTNGVTNTTGVGTYTKTTTPVGVSSVTNYVDFGTTGFNVNNYDISFTSSYKVTPADLVIHVSGSKTYGDTTSTSGSAYTYSTSGDTGGLQNGETINYNAATVNFTGLNEQANAGSYYKNMTGKTDTTGNTVDDMSGLTGTGNFKTGNYKISYVTDYTINPKALIITTTGTKVYGNPDPATSSYAMQQSGLTSWDVAKLTPDLKSNIVNSTDEQTDAGKYGTQNGGAQVLSYGNAIDNALNHNYTITYADGFTITKRPITHSLNGVKEYGTGSEHTTYTDNGFTNVPDFAKGTINSKTPKDISNSSDRTTPAGNYTDKLGVTYTGDWTKNYDISEITNLTITPGNFTYTADQTEYWRGVTIPPQTGKVTNKYGEDVSDLTGTMTWPTTATNQSSSGKYPILGHGANDNSGNYIVHQAATNPTALTIKDPGLDVHTDAATTQGLLGAWSPIKEPLLDVRYLNVTTPDGINRWGHAEAPTNLPSAPIPGGTIGTIGSITGATDKLPEYGTEHPLTTAINEHYTVMENEYGTATVQSAETDLNKKNSTVAH